MIDQTTLDGKIITAAFDLAASPGWAEVFLVPQVRKSVII